MKKYEDGRTGKIEMPGVRLRGPKCGCQNATGQVVSVLANDLRKREIAIIETVK